LLTSTFLFVYIPIFLFLPNFKSNTLIFKLLFYLFLSYLFYLISFIHSFIHPPIDSLSCFFHFPVSVF
jgi:hypothetical protein